MSWGMTSFSVLKDAKERDAEMFAVIIAFSLSLSVDRIVELFLALSHSEKYIFH